jgi:hypothetical protein
MGGWVYLGADVVGNMRGAEVAGAVHCMLLRSSNVRIVLLKFCMFLSVILAAFLRIFFGELTYFKAFFPVGSSTIFKSVALI